MSSGSKDTQASEAGRRDQAAESPAGALLGRRVLGVDARSGDLEVEYVASPDFSNRYGTVSGGFLAAMLDSLLALAAANALGAGTQVLTSDLRVSFGRPGRSGRVLGRARIDAKSARSISTTGELLGEDGMEIARGAATQRILRTGDAR